MKNTWKQYLMGMIASMVALQGIGLSQPVLAAEESHMAGDWSEEELEQRFAGICDSEDEVWLSSANDADYDVDPDGWVFENWVDEDGNGYTIGHYVDDGDGGEDDAEEDSDDEYADDDDEYDGDDDDDDDDDEDDDGYDDEDDDDSDDNESATNDDPDESKAPVYVNQIEITGCSNGVMAGNKPSYTAKAADREKYRVLCEGWESESGALNFSNAAAYLPTDTTFEKFVFGESYSYHIAAQMQSNYYLSEDVKIMLNGSYIPADKVKISGDRRRIYVLASYTAEAKCQHTFRSTVLAQAGCESVGSVQKICKTCGYEQVEDLPAKGHKDKTVTTKASLSANGSTIQKCSACGRETGKKILYSPATFKAAACTYTGKALKPAITVRDSKGNKISSTNYTVSYSNNKKVGTGTAKITFQNQYKGSKTISFTIKPVATQITAVTGSTKAFTVKWSKKTTQTSGYQLQYAAASGFTSGVTTINVSSNTTVSKKVSSLSSKKTYYVRVRTYRTVNGKKICSAWSTVKSVKTK